MKSKQSKACIRHERRNTINVKNVDNKEFEMLYTISTTKS